MIKRAPESQKNSLVPYQSPCLLLIQQYLQTHPRCYVLDLGSFTNAKLRYFSQTSSKIDSLDLSSRNEYQWDPISKTSQYDIIFCWDLFDYLPESVKEHLFIYLDKYAKKNALLYFFTRNQVKMPFHPCEFQLVIPNQLLISPTTKEEANCPRYSQMSLKKNLPNFNTHRAYLLKNGLQENLWIKNGDVHQTECDA